jgi:hypothetical protein
MRPILLVHYHDGRWRMDLDGESYGSFPTRLSAEVAATQLAQSADDLAPRVVVRVKHLDEVVWDENRLIHNAWTYLLHHSWYGTGASPIDAKELRQQVRLRVRECGQCELTENETVGFVLASFGVHQPRLH